MIKTFIEQADGAYMGIGLHIDEDEGTKFACLEIAISDDKDTVRRYITLEDMLCLTGKRTNLLQSPFTFIRFFKRKWRDILSICESEGVTEIIAEPELPSLKGAYRYLERMGFVWNSEDDYYELKLGGI